MPAQTAELCEYLYFTASQPIPPLQNLDVCAAPCAVAQAAQDGANIGVFERFGEKSEPLPLRPLRLRFFASFAFLSSV